MRTIRVLTPELRKELKVPLGLLIRGSFRHTTERLKEIVDEKKPEKLIAVGDRVSGNIIGGSIRLDVAVVDTKVMRKPVRPVSFKMDKTYRVGNPPGTLTDESWQAMAEAIRHNGRVRVLVEGEEDLLTLAAVLSAPEGSIVVYGQPRSGIVVIHVTEATKDRFRRIVERMEQMPSED